MGGPGLQVRSHVTLCERGQLARQPGEGVGGAGCITATQLHWSCDMLYAEGQSVARGFAAGLH